MTTLNATNSITRRAAIGGGIAYGLACMSSRRMLAATILPIFSVGRHASEADLYAFPGANADTTVIAVTAREVASRSEIRIHAGSRHWVFATDGSKSYGFPAFCGKVLTGPTGRTQVRDAVVIEVPNKMLAGMERTGIWAEQFNDSGDRRRIGSPFLAPVMMNNGTLARVYHAISPSQDREVLLEGVAEAVAAGARNTPQIGDPLAYGRRLASRLLPDVLHYNPDLPQGFSFAARNGRHPGEDVAAVVERRSMDPLWQARRPRPGASGMHSLTSRALSLWPEDASSASRDCGPLDFGGLFSLSGPNEYSGQRYGGNDRTRRLRGGSPPVYCGHLP